MYWVIAFAFAFDDTIIIIFNKPDFTGHSKLDTFTKPKAHNRKPYITTATWSSIYFSIPPKKQAARIETPPNPILA